MYKNQGWVDWGDWLGTDTVATSLREYRTFEEAREFVRSLGLKSQLEWVKYHKGEMPEKGVKPEDIPAKPDHVYKDNGWCGWGDWLGTGRIAHQYREFRTFEEGREFTRSLRVRNVEEWYKYCNGKLQEKGVKPEDIPYHPDRIYKGKGWISWYDWLGTSRKHRS